MSRTLNWDDTYCPKGHGNWVFIPASMLYPDVYYCPTCKLFYTPTVQKVTAEQITKEYNSDRASELIKRAEFITWKNNLTIKDMEKSIQPLDNNKKEN